MSKILVVDDVKRDREMLAGPFRSAHDVRSVKYLDEAKKLLDDWWPDIALVDAIFPKMQYDGPSFQAGALLELIEEKSTSYARRPQIIILSGQNDAAKKFDEVRSWLNDGRIQDVIAKATADMGVEFFEAVLHLRVDNLLERRKWRSVQTSAESAAEWFRRLGIITRSPKMLALRRDLEAATRSNASILLIGERGTGKTLLAHTMNVLTRPGKPFIVLDSANIPPALFESELFGIEGPSPGHQTFPKRKGLLEEAADGTFFLDNIHNLAADHQAKFNRVLQERKFNRVNGKLEIPFRARFITATNEDLAHLVQQGKFRAELYDRIKVMPIYIPKLSEREEDIQDLAESFVEAYVREQRDGGYPCPTMRLHPKCFDMLCAHEWPGNVRELENLVKRVAAFAAGADTNEVEINAGLLSELEPALGKVAAPGCVFDGILRQAGVASGRWADLTERDVCDAICVLLSDGAKVQFLAMLSALQPREAGAAEDTPKGRDSQDPATIHCLKALLYVLLCPEHRVSIQELMDLLPLKWAQVKKVMEHLVCKKELQLSPSFAPFVKLPEAGTKQVAELLPGILASRP